MSSVTGISWNTEAVMARYRALKGEGYDGLTASRVVRFEFVGDIADPRLSLQSVPTSIVPTTDVPTCEKCGEAPREGRYRACSGCRKAAYRGRHGQSEG